jgi:uncharacterized protein YbaR (Trm112 family)
VRPTLAELLRCPACGAHFDVQPERLTCGEGHAYPIVRGIPRLFDSARLAEEQVRTAQAFGYEWTHLALENPYTEEQWRHWVEPLTAADFEGRLVLEAGCGLGGFLEYTLQISAPSAGCGRWS